jgi:large subunit ribosomal protein L29
MKTLELREMPIHELEKLLEDKIEALFNLRFQKAKQILTSTHSIRTARRDIAQIKTFLNEKKRGLNVNR